MPVESPHTDANVFARLAARLPDYVALTRLDRPVGIWLLLWPTWWALWVAARGVPNLHEFVVFTLGVVLMRSAGCVINDVADRNLDGHVERTRARPLATGRVTVGEALVLFGVLMLLALGLVLTTNALTVQLALVAALLAASYPFMKRYTYFPQVVLGAAFGWGIPMAFAATGNDVPTVAWLLFVANLFWTVAYDTLYAMVDRDDDLRVGIRSTAILFGSADLTMIGILQALTLGTLVLAGMQWQAGALYWLGLFGALLLFAQQLWSVRSRGREVCFAAFLANNAVGMVIFAGIALDLAVRAAA